MIVVILLYLSEVRSQEVTTPASLLGPRHFNYHPYELNQFIQNAEPTKKGPVLFPNDAPPPPRPPLVVTSRPILESIARSELNPLPPNNSISESKQSPQNSPNLEPFRNIVNFDTNVGVSSDPGQNFVDVDFTGSNPESQASAYNVVPYSDLLRSSRVNEYLQNNRYDFQQLQEHTLPPIYKARSDHARHNVIKLKKKPVRYNEDEYYQYDNNVSDENRNTQYDENNNYAFSYRVNDHKTGDDFSHSQQSSGSATNGEYRVRLPDGRVQIVSYTADENGYNANVRYEETAIKENNFNNNQKETSINTLYNNYKPKNDITNEYVNNDYIDYKQKDYTNINEPIKDYNTNDYNDFSNEYNYNYDPYKSKFSVYSPIYTSTIKPIVENDISDSVKYESSTEAVVSIGNRSFNRNLYTNVNNPKPSFVPPSVSFVTPSTYLASTIASLRDRITAKPILTKSFIDRINKYLTFK